MSHALCDGCPLRLAAFAVMQALGVGQCKAEVRATRLLTPKEAASRLGVSVKWLQRRKHKLDFIVPLDHGWRVHEERLERYISRRR